MPYINGVPKPSELLEALLMGRIEWEDAPEAIRSWAQLEIYRGACEILKAPDRGTRRNMLGRVPKAVRAQVEAEVIRLWQERRG